MCVCEVVRKVISNMCDLGPRRLAKSYTYDRSNSRPRRLSRGVAAEAKTEGFFPESFKPLKGYRLANSCPEGDRTKCAHLGRTLMGVTNFVGRANVAFRQVGGREAKVD